MKRTLFIGIIAVATTISAVGTSTATAAPHDLTMAEMAATIGHQYDQAPPPAGQTPKSRANWLMNERQALGRTPQQWLDWTHDTFAFRTESFAPTATDLNASIGSIYASLGLSLHPLDSVRIAGEAARLPDAVRAPFASLVSVIASAYAAQVPLARTVMARIRPGMDLRTMLSTHERDAMTAREATIMRALNAFRAATQSYFESAPVTPGPIFADPNSLIVLGGSGDDTYNRNPGMFPDPILLVDPSGNDTYLNSAGGACPFWPTGTGGLGDFVTCNSLVLSVVADLGDGTSTPSNDRYSYDGVPSAVQGGGAVGGIGMLVDVAGNDSYYGKMTRGAIDAIQTYVDGGGQGYGYAGAGLLLDGAGDDTYQFDVRSTKGKGIWDYAQGFGGGGGIGIASDLGGRDHYLSNGLGLGTITSSFEGIYTNGTGFYCGIGIQTDTGGGDDVIRAVDIAQSVDFYAQGFGAFGGVGILADDGGNDTYYTLEKADGSGPPHIDPLLNCAFGTASFAGVGIMIDGGGNDSYYGGSISPKGAFVMDNGWGGPGAAYGLFVDAGGNDTYTMEALGTPSIIEGRGYFDGVGYADPVKAFSGEQNWFGTFVDLGGKDTYTGGVGADDTWWTFGVDEAS